MATSKVIVKNLVDITHLYTEKAYDTIHRVETAGNVDLSSLQFDHKNKKYGIYYEPSSPSIVKFSIGHIREPLEQFDFVDFGSGKGRVVLIAASYPFRRVTGVEFSPELHAIAESNLLSFRGRNLTRELRLLNIDATKFEFEDHAYIIFLYNPFGLSVMRRISNMINDARHRWGRPMYIVYYNSNSKSCFDFLDGFKKIYDDLAPWFFSTRFRRPLTIWQSID